MVQFFTLWHFFARTWRQKHPACISLSSFFNTQHLFSFVFLPLTDMRTSFNCLHTVGLDHRVLVYTIHKRNKGQRKRNELYWLSWSGNLFTYIRSDSLHIGRRTSDLVKFLYGPSETWLFVDQCDYISLHLYMLCMLSTETIPAQV